MNVPRSPVKSPVSATPPRARQASVSLKTVAEHLGLSTAAISRVLSGSPAARSIPPATQQKIFEAANLLGYRPNVMARSLRNKRTFTVGVMVPEVSEGYATAVLSGIEQPLLEQDYVYFVMSHRHRPDLIERLQNVLMARSIEGLIAIDTPLAHALHIPTVTVSGHHEPRGVTNILLNHSRAAALALEHLHGLRHTRIAIIQGQTFSSDTQPRWLAIRAAMAALEIPVDKRLVAQLEGEAPTHEPGYHATQRLLATRAQMAADKRFTALFAFNDISAIGAIRAIREAGLRVPEDVSVVGFDDVQSAAFQNPGLTTVRQPLQQMGILAAQTLLEQIKSWAENNTADHAPEKQQERMVEPELIVRGSTAIARRRVLVASASEAPPERS